MSTWESIFPEAGGNLPYLSLVPHSLRRINNATNTNSAVINRDYLTAFTARADVTINRVWWLRANTGAANVSLGIYGATGTLLTDCAVDTNAVAGVHQVTTSNVNLVSGQLYYFAINVSSLVAVCAPGDITADDVINNALNFMNFNVLIYSSVPAHSEIISAAFKSRTTALMPATQTMTGWTAQALNIYGGFTPI